MSVIFLQLTLSNLLILLAFFFVQILSLCLEGFCMSLLLEPQENDLSLHLSPPLPTYIMDFRIKDSSEIAESQSRLNHRFAC